MTVHTGAKKGVFRTIPFVNLQRLHQMMGSSLDAAFFNVVKDASFTMGPKLEAFEDNFAAYIGVRHAVGVGSGTDALHFALRACGVGPGDEVITVVNTFAATAEAILMCGARPSSSTVEDTLLMDLDAVEAAVTDRTKAIIPVHLYGQSVDMDRLMAIARHGASRSSRTRARRTAPGAGSSASEASGTRDASASIRARTWARWATAASSPPTTPRSPRGSGCCATTARRAVRLHVESGYCRRLHGLQAAFLSAKLPHLDEWNALRMRAAALYDDMLAGRRRRSRPRRRRCTHVYHLYVVHVDGP